MVPAQPVIGRHSYYPSDLSLRVWGPGENIIIGSFCSIAEEVTICSGGKHRTDFASTFPFEQVIFKRPGRDRVAQSTRDTVIGNDVWICAKSMILGGVHVGHGAVIAAGSVVYTRVPAYAVVGGNPATFMYSRFDSETVKGLLRIAWWDWTDEYIRDNLEWFYKPAAEFVAHFDPLR
jgi:chloramphenicol O-acetyltransferase type B